MTRCSVNESRTRIVSNMVAVQQWDIKIIPHFLQWMITRKIVRIHVKDSGISFNIASLQNLVRNFVRENVTVTFLCPVAFWTTCHFIKTVFNFF